jgi:hypothetical protein
MIARIGFLLGAACCMLLPVTPVSAQTTSSSDFQTFVHSSKSKILVGDALSKLPVARLGGCQQPFAVAGMRYSVTEPMTFDQSGEPTAGQWKMELSTNACNNPFVVNVFFTARNAGDYQTDFGLSGTTNADLVAQHSALPSAYRAAAQFAKNCTEFDAVSASFGGYGLPDASQPAPAAGAAIPAWWETWVVRGCGRSYDVPIGFETKAGSIAIHSYGTKVAEHKG